MSPKKISEQGLEISYHGRYYWGADQEFWRDPELSCSAKVVWILLRSAASMPNGVKMSVLSHWANRYYAGILHDLQELIGAGYVKRTIVRRNGALVDKVLYELYDISMLQKLENTQCARTSKNGLRKTESVKRTQVRSKAVNTNIVKSSSPNPPIEEEEIRDIVPPVLPYPFDKLLPAHRQEAVRLCSKHGLNIQEQVHAIKALHTEIDNPAHYLLTVLRKGGIAGAAELVEKVKESAASIATNRKRIEDAQRRGDIPRWARQEAVPGERP